MRLIIILCFLISTKLHAQQSCLQIESTLNGTSILCDQTDGNKVMALRCDVESLKCFTGKGSELVTKINNGIFTDGEAVIGEAYLKDDQNLVFSYGDLSQSCEVQVFRCGR